ncbi:MAG TPA: ABC transporter permease [Chitinophagaceae bacterium]|jgi:putative ABC transport system permease protein
MLKNYLKVALRNLWKNKGYSAINIFGLAIGLATCLLILLYVWDELSYDRYNEKADRIYRVDGDISFGGNHFILAVAPDPMGPTLKKDYPQVEQYVRFRQRGSLLIQKGDENVQEGNFVYADSTLFDVFTLPMISGNPRTALVEPKSIVLTEKAALKYFNSTDVAGKNLLINHTDNYKVTGVIKNIPGRSHFSFDFYISMATLDESRENVWISNNFNTYIVLKKGADPKALEAQFGSLMNKYMGPQVQQIMSISMEQFTKAGNWDTYTLMPLKQIHLHSNKTSELGPNGSVQYVYIFSAIAVFILLIACINFMNLSTARSSNRAKEVGIRKVLGTMRGALIGQFLTESMLISFIGLILALGIAGLLLPYFNQLSGKQLILRLFTTPWLLPALLLLVAVVGLLAGSYPAFFLSAFQPIAVLKGGASKGFKGGWLRSSLVVFQFTISICLIIATAVIYRQLNYIQHQNLGFDREQVLIIKNTEALKDQATAFKNELLRLPGAKNATMTGYLPTAYWRNDAPLFTEATPDPKKAVTTQIWQVDENYIPTLGMQMASGRNFSREYPTDSSGIVINEVAAKMLGSKDLLNKNLYMMTDFAHKANLTAFHIIGVVKNFNFNSLREQVTPLVFLWRQNRGSIAIRISTTDIPGVVAQVEKTWQSMSTGQAFSYSFMNDDFNRIYDSERHIGRIVISFSAFAIFIACLGLFGLVTYAAEQRTREIGVRKVLGASVSNIVGMLSKDFLKLVLLAALIAFPFAWWAMNKWLQDFAYRITISWWIFFSAGLLAIVIALATICFQAIKAALMNPVKSLRTE